MSARTRGPSRQAPLWPTEKLPSPIADKLQWKLMRVQVMILCGSLHSDLYFGMSQNGSILTASQTEFQVSRAKNSQYRPPFLIGLNRVYCLSSKAFPISFMSLDSGKRHAIRASLQNREITHLVAGPRDSQTLFLGCRHLVKKERWEVHKLSFKPTRLDRTYTFNGEKLVDFHPLNNCLIAVGSKGTVALCSPLNTHSYTLSLQPHISILSSNVDQKWLYLGTSDGVLLKRPAAALKGRTHSIKLYNTGIYCIKPLKDRLITLSLTKLSLIDAKNGTILNKNAGPSLEPGDYLLRKSIAISEDQTVWVASSNLNLYRTNLKKSVH